MSEKEIKPKELEEIVNKTNQIKLEKEKYKVNYLFETDEKSTDLDEETIQEIIDRRLQTADKSDTLLMTFLLDMKNADKNLPLKRRLGDAFRHMDDITMEKISKYMDEDDEDDYEFPRCKFLNDEYEKENVLFWLERHIKQLECRITIYDPEYFSDEESIPLEGMEQIEHMCDEYDIDELAQLDILHNEELIEMLEEQTSKKYYPSTKELLEKIKNYQK